MDTLRQRRYRMGKSGRQSLLRAFLKWQHAARTDAAPSPRVQLHIAVPLEKSPSCRAWKMAHARSTLEPVQKVPELSLPKARSYPARSLIESRRRTHWAARYLRKVHAAKMRKFPSYRLDQIFSCSNLFVQRDPQNLASLFFHGPAVSRCADPKALLRGVFQSANRDACHSLQNNIDLNDCTLRLPAAADSPASMRRPDIFSAADGLQPRGETLSRHARR